MAEAAVWDRCLTYFSDSMLDPQVEMCLRAVDCRGNGDGRFYLEGPAEAVQTLRQIQVPLERNLSLAAGRPSTVEFKITSQGRVDFLRVMSAWRVLQTDWPEPVWAVPGMLPVGLALLAGRIKIGKSWLAMQVCRAVGTGGEFLGAELEPGRFLYLSLEDPPRRVKSRMQQQGWPALESLKESGFIFLPDFQEQIGPLNEGGGEKLAEQIGRRRYKLVIIDTIGRAFRGDINSYDEMTEALSPMQAMAFEQECVVLLLDHHRKLFSAEPDVVLDVIGSTAKAGVADTILGLYRKRGELGAKLSMIGRDVEERTLQLRMDQQRGLWTLDGSPGPELTERDEEVMAALEVLGGQVSGATIAEAVGQNRGNTYKRLVKLINMGLVIREEGESGPVYSQVEAGE